MSIQHIDIESPISSERSVFFRFFTNYTYHMLNIETGRNRQADFIWKIDSYADGDPILYYSVSNGLTWELFFTDVDGESAEADISHSKYMANQLLNWEAGIALLGDNNYVIENQT